MKKSGISKWVIGGLVAVLGVWGLSKLAKGSSKTLFEAYMAELNAFQGTRPQLEEIRYRFEADWLSAPPKLTYQQYLDLYSAYLAIYNSLP